MNHFFVTLFLIVIFLVAIGYATDALHRRGGPLSERKFSALRALFIAGLFLFLSFCANYFLASTGLRRSIGSERLTSKDPLGTLLFGGSGMRSNHLFALMFVAASFVAAAYFLKYAGKVLDAITRRDWQRDGLAFVLLLLKFLVVTALAVVFLWTDTGILLFRSATMLWPDDLAAMPASLPSPGRIIQGHAGTMGAFLLTVLMFWYPCYILLAEKHFASCWAHYNDACRQGAATQAQIAPQLAPVPPAPAIAPVAMPTPPLPVAGNNAPIPVGAPNGPAPGGAAPWVRPVPFNPGPQNGNGHRPVRV